MSGPVLEIASQSQIPIVLVQLPGDGLYVNPDAAEFEIVDFNVELNGTPEYNGEDEHGSTLHVGDGDDDEDGDDDSKHHGVTSSGTYSHHDVFLFQESTSHVSVQCSIF